MPPGFLPKSIYHYCSLQTAIAILGSDSIRVTSLFHMNDSLEHKWLRNVAADEVKELIREEPNDDYETIRSLLLEDQIYDIYCACFSSLGDSLGQWRAYADDGYGVALGFDPNNLKFHKKGDFWFGGTNDQLELCKVNYDLNDQRALTRKSLQSIQTLFGDEKMRTD